MNLENFKGLFLKTLIGCLVAAAGLAVITILVGEINDITGKALFTIALIALHSGVSFSFILNNEKQQTFDNLSFFTNSTFYIIVLSFITSILGTWGVIDGEFVFRLYGLYFVLLFAVLHGEILAKTRGKQANIDSVVAANYVLMAIVVFMLLPVIFVSDVEFLTDFYYRFLAAAGIIDATLTLIAVILHKLYLQKHPKVADPVFAPQYTAVPGQPGQFTQVPVAQQPRRHMNIFVVILVGYVVLQIAGGLFMAVVGGGFRN